MGSRERFTTALERSTIRMREASFFGADVRVLNGGFRQRKNNRSLIMAQREFVHPFAVEFKRLAYEAVKRKNDRWLRCAA